MPELNPAQFRFDHLYTDWNDAHHINAFAGDEKVGEMHWAARHRGKIAHIWTDPEFQRQGVATGMWNAALQSHAQDPDTVPKPRHSPVRSPAGDAWARSLGVRLPKLQPDV